MNCFHRTGETGLLWVIQQNKTEQSILVTFIKTFKGQQIIITNGYQVLQMFVGLDFKGIV